MLSGIQFQNKNAPREVKTKTALFGITDVHGNFSAMSKLITAGSAFTRKYDSMDIDTFKLSSGDIGISISEDKQKYSFDFLKQIGIDVAALGNHEFDLGSKKLAKLIANSTLVFVAANFDAMDSDTMNENPLKVLMAKYTKFDENKSAKKIFNSYIITKPDGNRYGFIGSVPTNMDKIVAGFSKLGINVFDEDKTKKAIAEEIRNLKEQGVNKIIFISHLGDEIDESIAKSEDTAGIDVILSGHSHKKIEKVVMSYTDEPVVIMQAGENGVNYSQLEVDFDADGVIQRAVGGVKNTDVHKEDEDFELETSKKYGSKESIGQVIDDVTNTKTANQMTEIMMEVMHDQWS